MKLLVVILVAVGIAGFVVSWLATRYSREKRSIERYNQTMGVIRRVSGEGGEPEAQQQVHPAEARPHIRVVGDGQKKPEPQTQEPAGATPPEEDAPASPPRTVPINSRIAPQAETGAEEEAPRAKRSVPRSMPPAEIAKALSKISRPPAATPREEAAPAADAPEDAPAAANGSESPRPPLVFDERAGMAGGDEAPVLKRDRGVSRMSGPPVVGKYVAVAVIALVVLLGAYLLLSNLGSSPAKSASSVTTASVATTTTKPPATTTTVPKAVVPVSSSSSSATFHAPAGKYTVVVSVSAPCWLAQSTSVGGTISWDAVLQSGQSHTFTTSGDLVLRSGASTYMTVTMNGVPVKFNSPPGAFDLVFSTSA